MSKGVKKRTRGVAGKSPNVLTLFEKFLLVNVVFPLSRAGSFIMLITDHMIEKQDKVYNGPRDILFNEN